MVVPKRFELLSSGSEPDMLPLHQGTIWFWRKGSNLHTVQDGLRQSQSLFSVPLEYARAYIGAFGQNRTVNRGLLNHRFTVELRRRRRFYMKSPNCILLTTNIRGAIYFREPHSWTNRTELNCQLMLGEHSFYH